MPATGAPAQWASAGRACPGAWQHSHGPGRGHCCGAAAATALAAEQRREELSPNALCDPEEAVKLLFSPPPHFSHFTQILTLIHFRGISGLRVKHSSAD